MPGPERHGWNAHVENYFDERITHKESTGEDESPDQDQLLAGVKDAEDRADVERGVDRHGQPVDGE